jgi:hypothetical protein
MVASPVRANIGVPDAHLTAQRPITPTSPKSHVNVNLGFNPANMTQQHKHQKSGKSSKSSSSSSSSSDEHKKKGPKSPAQFENDPSLPQFMRSVPPGAELIALPSLQKDNFSTSECNGFMDHIIWRLKVALGSATVLRDYELALSSEQRTLLLRRMASAAKEIKDITAVLRRLELPVDQRELKQRALHEAAHRIGERIVAIGNCVFDSKAGQKFKPEFPEAFANFVGSVRQTTEAVKAVKFSSMDAALRVRVGHH